VSVKHNKLHHLTRKISEFYITICTLDYFKYRIFLLRQNVYMNNSKQLILRDFNLSRKNCDYKTQSKNGTLMKRQSVKELNCEVISISR